MGASYPEDDARPRMVVWISTIQLIFVARWHSSSKLIGRGRLPA